MLNYLYEWGCISKVNPFIYYIKRVHKESQYFINSIKKGYMCINYIKGCINKVKDLLFVWIRVHKQSKSFFNCKKGALAK
jgi:hypothetical protein